MAEFGYDLLKINYLCGSNNSLEQYKLVYDKVVICLKLTTFVVATTVIVKTCLLSKGCDLLKINYLCGSNNSKKLVLFLSTLL